MPPIAQSVCGGLSPTADPHLIELAFAAGISKQVELQGAAWGDHVLNLLHAARRNWLKAEVLRGSLLINNPQHSTLIH